MNVLNVLYFFFKQMAFIDCLFTCYLFTMMTLRYHIFVNASTYNDGANVLKQLTANYTKEMRPVLDQSDPVVVKIIPMLRSINNYDEVTGTLSIILVLIEEWTDEKLKWDPTQYGGFRLMVLPQKNLWKPELYLINAAAAIVPIGNDAFKIRVLFDGSAEWFTGGNIQASCSPDMTYFPFDIQTCNLIFAPWGYYESEVALDATASVDVSNVTPNGAWTLKEATYKVYGDGMSIVEITIKIERKSLYYILTLIFPILSLCLLNPMVFTLPYDSGERVSFCITILLSFAVFMTLTGDVVPKVSEPMPLLCIYLFIVQMFSGIIMTTNGLICRAYDHDDDDPVPLLLWKITLICIKLCGCSCCNKSSISPKTTLDQDKGNLQLEHFQESENSNEKKDSKQNQGAKTSWITVAKTMDCVSFILSHCLFISVSIGFLVHSTIRGGT